MDYGNTNTKNDEDNLTSLYKIIKEFGKRGNNNSINGKRIMKITNLMKKDFPTSQFDNHNWYNNAAE